MLTALEARCRHLHITTIFSILLLKRKCNPFLRHVMIIMLSGEIREKKLVSPDDAMSYPINYLRQLFPEVVSKGFLRCRGKEKIM